MYLHNFNILISTYIYNLRQRFMWWQPYLHARYKHDLVAFESCLSLQDFITSSNTTMSVKVYLICDFRSHELELIVPPITDLHMNEYNKISIAKSL